MFEKLYDDIYSQRAEIIQNKMSADQIKDLVQEFNNKVKLHEMDENFKKMEVEPIDVGDTKRQNKKGGIANFW